MLGKSAVFIVVVFILSCFSTHTYKKMNGIPKINVTDNNTALRCLIKNDTIQLIFKNKSNKDLYISNPCRVNTYVHVFNNKGEETQRKVMVRIDPRCAQKTFKIEPNGYKTFNYYKLSEQFFVESKHKYEIFFEYYLPSFESNDEVNIKSEITEYIAP